MDRVNLRELLSLLQLDTHCTISIYMPTVLTGKDTRENRIRYKDLLESVEKKLHASGMEERVIKKLLHPAQKLIDDYTFWEYQSNTLALFIADGQAFFYRLPITYEETVVIDPKPYFTPLLPLITHNATFFILAISANLAKFFEADRFEIKEINVPDMPDNMGDALWYKKIQKDVQFQTETGYKGAAGERDAIFHGQAQWIDKHKKYIVEYLQQVDQSLHHILVNKNYPLIIAGAKGILPLFQEATRYKHLLDKNVEGNPERMDLDVLHAHSWKIMEGYLEKQEKKVVDKYRDLIGSKRFITNLGEIMRCADDGLVEALFVDEHKHIWGKYDKNGRTIQKETSDTPENYDLLSLAAIETLSKKGKVFVLPDSLMPVDTPSAAVLRYSM